MRKKIIIILSIILIIAISILIYFKITYISKNEVKAIILNSINQKEDIHFRSIELKLDQNIYEAEIYYNMVEYEYKINAKTGKIIYTDFKLENTNTSAPQDTNSQTKEITLEKAKTIALEDANINSAVTFTETKTDYENGNKIYEIEFIYNNYKYSYEINAITGEITSYEKDIR